MESLVEGYEEDLEEDEVDDDDERTLTEPTGVYCVQCTDEIEMVTEVFLLRIVQPFVIEGKLECRDVLSNTGDFLYEPAFYCFECWEEASEDVQTKHEDIPPILDPNGIILCDICESDICQGESMGILDFGEIHWSERTPNNKHSPVFVNMNDTKHICLSCISKLEFERGDLLWPEGIEPVHGFGEVCKDGIFERCWRHGNCHCK